MRAMRGADRAVLLRRLAAVAPGDLPAGCGVVAIAEEDAAGERNLPKKQRILTPERASRGPASGLRKGGCLRGGALQGQKDNRRSFLHKENQSCLIIRG